MKKSPRPVFFHTSLLTALFLGLFLFANAVPAHAQFTPYWETFNSGNSPLPGNYVNAIAIDRDGSKWFGTYGSGVAHLVGTTWTIYNTSNSGLPSNLIHTITVANDGSKWFSTAYGGVARFDGTTWTVYNSSNSPLPVTSDINGSIFGGAVDHNGDLWFGTVSGAARFDPTPGLATPWTIYGPSDGLNWGVSDLAVDLDGSIWAATSHSGIGHYDGTLWTIYDTVSTNHQLSSNTWLSVAVDPAGIKWFGDNVGGVGVTSFDGTNWTNYNTSNSPLPSNWIQKIVIGPDGEKWFAAVYGGAAELVGTNWTIYNTSNSQIASNVVVSLAVDNGDVWIGTFDAGVSVFHEKQPNHLPVLGPISAPLNPVPVNASINASANFTDADSLDTHTAQWNWGDSGSSAGSVTETSGSGSVTGSHTYSTPGVYTLKLTVTDNNGGSASALYQYVVIYDPNGGFVTGGGWINSPAGAYLPNPSLTGKATFGFVARYKKGASIPDGNTEFQFHAAGFNFNSASYDWLVVTGPKAQYKGTGTINGQGNYAFILTAIDGKATGGGNVDRFRIRIWDKSTGNIVYDNQMNAKDSDDPTTALGGGSISIKKA